jgi:hypothetical protein
MGPSGPGSPNHCGGENLRSLFFGGEEGLPEFLFGGDFAGRGNKKTGSGFGNEGQFSEDLKGMICYLPMT